MVSGRDIWPGFIHKTDGVLWHRVGVDVARIFNLTRIPLPIGVVLAIHPVDVVALAVLNPIL